MSIKHKKLVKITILTNFCNQLHNATEIYKLQYIFLFKRKGESYEQRKCENQV